MQFRGLVIAAVILAGLAGGIWYSNKQAETEKAKPAPSKTTPMVDVLAADITELSITQRGIEPMVLRRDPSNNQWTMVSEPKLPLDQDAATTLATGATGIRWDTVIEETATDLIQYGLDPPQVVVSVKDKKGKTSKIFLGDNTPVANMVYAMQAGTKKVVGVASHMGLDVKKTANDLRDKRLLPVDESKLAKMELLRPGAAIEFGRNAKGEWQILKPQALRTDNLAADEVFRKAKEAKFDPALGDEEQKKNAANFGAATLVATLKLTDALGTKSLEVKQAKDGVFLAKSSAVPGVFKVADELGKGLEKGLEDFRNKKLLDFGFEDPARVAIKNGSKLSTLEKKGEDWLLNGKKADSAAVQGLIDSLRQLSALKFVPKGFTSAFFEVSVTQKDGKTTEKLLVSKTGNFHYAKRDGEADEYEIDPKVITDLEAALGAIEKPPAPAAKK